MSGPPPYWALVLALSRRFTVPEMTRDDVAQAGWLAVAEVLARRPDAPESYLVGAVCTRLRQLHYQAARSRGYADRHAARAARARPPEPPDVLAERAEVWRLVDRLPPGERAVVLLRYRDYRAPPGDPGRQRRNKVSTAAAAFGAAPVASQAEVAAALGLSRQRVQVLERQALARLRRWLAG